VHAVYLDSSSVVKRYIHEAGSEVVDLVYAKAENGASRMVISLWNVGEVLGVLDRYRSKRLLDDETLLRCTRSFLAESEKIIRLGGMQILPFTLNILTETYWLVLKHHIYQADALQVATCKLSESDLFLSAEKELLSVARSEKIEALNVETDERQIRNLMLRV
jgi:predicted nucleic acid-binding protein